MMIYETLKANPKINNDFDYKRAKVELSRLSKIIATGCCADAAKAQLFADSVSEYETRTMTPTF